MAKHYLFLFSIFKPGISTLALAEKHVFFYNRKASSSLQTYQTCSQESMIWSGWWFQPPISKICLSSWKSSPIFGVKIKNMWNHRSPVMIFFFDPPPAGHPAIEANAVERPSQYPPGESRIPMNQVGCGKKRWTYQYKTWSILWSHNDNLNFDIFEPKSAPSCHFQWQMSAACTRFTATTDLAQKRGRTWWCSLYKRFHAWMHMQPEKSTLTKSLLSFTKSCQSNHALEAAFSAVQMLVEMVSLIAIAAEATVPSCAMM